MCDMVMQLHEIKKIVSKIDGWLMLEEGELLYNLAKKCTGKGVIVEIGSWKGKSTIWLGQGSKAGNKVKIYAIDHHIGSILHRKLGKVNTFQEFKENIKNAHVDEVIIPIVKTSEEAAKNFNKPIELIFIDGEHEYEYVKKDFDIWFPKVIDGGIMAFHDTAGWFIGSGPDRVVDTYVYKSPYFKRVRLCYSITYGTKTGQNTLIDRSGNIFSFWYKNFYNFFSRYHSYIPDYVKCLLKKTLFT